MLARTAASPGANTPANPKLEPIFKLLKEKKYDEVARLIGLKPEMPASNQIVYWQYFTAMAPSNNQTKSFNTKELEQIIQWLNDNKVNFAQVFLNSQLGKILSELKYDKNQISPILISLSIHVKFGKILKDSKFPSEQIGNLLCRFIKSPDKKKALEILRHAPGITYDDTGDYNAHDNEEFNEKYDDNFARYYDPATGDRPLHLACAEEKLDHELIEALIHRGAFLTDRNKNKETPIDYLLKSGVDIKDFLDKHFGVLSEEHLCKLILYFSLKKRFDLARHLLQKADKENIELDLYYFDEKTGSTILHLAVEQTTDIEYTQLVLQHNIKLSIEKENNAKKTPFISAIEKGNFDTVKLLIDTCSQRQSPRINGILYTKDKVADKRSPGQKWLDFQMPVPGASTYDCNAEHLGNVFILLVRANQLDLALDLYSKRSDIKIDTLDPETKNNVAHYAASLSHPKKEELFILLATLGINMELENNKKETPISILAAQNDHKVLATLFMRFREKFSPETLYQTAKCIIFGRKDLSYLPLFLQQMEAHPQTDVLKKQNLTKELILALIKDATDGKKVTEIFTILNSLREKIPYFALQKTGIFSWATSDCWRDVSTEAMERIVALEPQPNLKPQASH